MVNLRELKAGDTVWYERDDGKWFLARVDHVYANLVDLTLHPYTLPFLESAETKLTWVESGRIHPAEGADGLFREAARLAESASQVAVEVAQQRGRPLDDMQGFFVKDAVLHAYLTLMRQQQGQG
ncbi:MAG TPA: hypothetical protein PLD25_14155 [Chloroflexota bacterium]|nr:hypothetical protein [Chloroflexota bacterium]HUM68234.1 hypothetical protein [Chloroflexota bacterium]